MTRCKRCGIEKNMNEWEDYYKIKGYLCEDCYFNKLEIKNRIEESKNEN